MVEHKSTNSMEELRFTFSKTGGPENLPPNIIAKLEMWDLPQTNLFHRSTLPPPNNVLAQHGSYVLIAEHDFAPTLFARGEGRHTDERKRQEEGSQLLYTEVPRDGTKQLLDDGKKIKPIVLDMITPIIVWRGLQGEDNAIQGEFHSRKWIIKIKFGITT